MTEIERKALALMNEVRTEYPATTSDRTVRENPVEGAHRKQAIATLAFECHRLRGVLRYIAEVGYVDQQSGNQNFEYLQEIARAALQETSHDA